MVKNNFLYSISLIVLVVLLQGCSAQKKFAKERSKYMKNTYLDLVKNIDQGEISIINDTIKVLFPNHLLFRVNSTSINDNVRPLIVRFTKVLNQHQKTSVIANGYTDNTGTDKINETLSRGRALASKALLEEYHITPSRVDAIWMGAKNPIASNDTEEGRQKNRRVEFIILYDVAPPTK